MSNDPAVETAGHDGREKRIDTLIREWLEAVDRGEPLDREAFLEQHADLRAELEEFLDSQDQLHSFVRWMRPPAADSSASDESGLRFGHYEILEELDRGGMGIVYRARDSELDRVVALKLILTGRLASGEEVGRFLREARAASQLDHPHIVPIYEIGEVEGQRYFTMKILEGGSLAERGPPLRHDFRAIAQLLETIARAVHHAHLKGILHRDLKPANILFDAGETPHVVDFGLSRFMAGGGSVTRSGSVLGTPSYMPPEHASGRRCKWTPAADVYSLGVILYELLVGRAPFSGGSSLEILKQVEQREPEPPRSVDPRIPRDLETICLKCLRKEPHRRYSKAADLATDLGHFLAGVPVDARRSSSLERVWRWARRNTALASLTAAVTALLLVVTVGSVVFSLQVRERLWHALLLQGRADRYRGDAGRRSRALGAIGEAARIRPTRELRNEAIACMAIVDLHLQRVLPGFCGKVNLGSAVDRQGSRYAYGDASGSIVVYRVRDGGVEWSSPPCGGWVRHLDFSGDGQCLGVVHITTGGLVFRLWTIGRPGEHRLELPVADGFRPFEFDRQGRRLAVALPDGSVVLVKLASCQIERRLATGGGRGSSRFVSFAPEGGRLAVGFADADAEVYEVESGARVQRFAGTRGPVAWHPRGELVALRSRTLRTIWIRDLATGRDLGELAGHQASVTDLDFSPDGALLASTSWDGTLRLWDFRYGRELVAGRANRGVRFSHDGSSLGAMSNFSPSGIWELVPSRELRLLVDETRPDESAHVRATVFGPDGAWLAAAERGLTLWAVHSGRRLAHLPIGEVYSVFLDGDGDSQALVTFGALGLQRWPLEQRPDGAGGSVLAIGPPEALSPQRPAEAGMARLSRDRRILARIDNFALGKITLLDRRTGEQRILQKPLVRYVDLDPEGRWAAGGSWHGTGVRVWDLAGGGGGIDLDVEGNAIVGFSPDSRSLVTGGGREFVAWKVGSWQPRWRAVRENPGDLPGALTFAPGGDLLAVAHSLTGVRLLSAEDGEEVATLLTPCPGIVTAFSFSPGGGFLAVATESQGVHLWDLRLLRRELRNLGLDWSSDPLPPAPTPVNPSRAEVRLGALAPSGS